MIRCGYLVDDNINPNQLIAPPHEFDKIRLTPLRSKFMVVGTKDEIFDWLKHYEELVCEFDQEFDHSKTSLRHNNTTTNKFKISVKNHVQEITFELYNEEEKHHHHGVISKFISFGTKKYNGSTRMRLEINSRNYDDNLSTSKSANPTLAMKAKGKDGVNLRFVLNEWEKHHGKSKTLNNQNKLRSTCDYE
ncbi:hypothetical protein RclHR1_19270004 [Rhizophagus clarus]|nr:hypothetical protein RclHR1_19270004 [Rhizophagus clarus]